MTQTRTSSIILSAALTVLLVSCGSDQKSGTASTPIPQGMIPMDLSAYGKPFTLPVPDTAGAPLTITEEPDGALTVKSGRSFGMSIYEQGADLKLKKDDIQSDEVNRLKRVVREDSVTLMWESAITESEYHFVCNRKLKGSEYSFTDIAGAGLGEEATKNMLESALHAEEKNK